MKKLFFILVALTIAATTVLAQKENGNSGTQWGIKLGPNLSTWVGDDADISTSSDKKMKIGLQGGFFAMIPIADMFYFQPEILYSLQGTRYEENDDKLTFSTHHLNIPLTLRFQTSTGFYLVFGPQVGFALSGKSKLEIQGQETEDDLEDLRSVLLSGLIGAGYKSNSGFGIYARYGRSFSKAFDLDGEDDPEIYDSVISLNLFYMLNASK